MSVICLVVVSRLMWSSCNGAGWCVVCTEEMLYVEF
jgi:hypothetical protein